MAQKINNHDTLYIDQFTKDMHKAISIRRAGIILTLSGISAIVAGGITSLIMAANPPADPNEDFMADLIDLVPIALGSLAGLACIVVGVPLKAIGESRIDAKAMLSLKMYDILPKNSMAFSLGLTLRF
ncbi:MAG TPA: hypothetical protein DDW27_17600 [Bacteroidales bacterium]|nr:hypothetical protein [Bacteroidales bacterium]